jgi:hypothetical protein
MKLLDDGIDRIAWWSPNVGSPARICSKTIRGSNLTAEVALGTPLPAKNAAS